MVGKTRFVLTFCLLFSVCTLHGQSGVTHDLPDGVYRTLQDFNARKPDTTQKVRKLNLGVPTAMAFADTLVDHALFLGKNNSAIKKVFAVVYQGDIYFQEWGMKQLMAENYGHSAITASPAFHRVHFTGRYFYGEATFDPSNDMGLFTATAMFGIVGGLTYAALNDVPLSGNQTALAPFVYDSKSNTFYVFVVRPRLKSFMKSFYPEYPLELEEAKLDIETVRGLFMDLNQRDQKG